MSVNLYKVLLLTYSAEDNFTIADPEIGGQDADIINALEY